MVKKNNKPNKKLLNILKASNSQLVSRHYFGLPPQFTGGIDYRKRLPWPNVLIVEEDANDTKGFFLYRYTKDGTYCGDTWHMNLEDAKHQASSEYGESLGEWENIPTDVNDPKEYALQKAREDHHSGR